MSDLPSHVVASISFIGRGGGLVKTLGGFRKGQHTVPDAANATTTAFLARICAGELTAEAEGLFQEVRTGLGYKRREVSLSVASPVATLAARDFAVELAYLLDPADPARYLTTSTMRELHDVALARTESFARIFAGRFTEIEFGLAQGAQVEAVIDAIEALDAESGLAVDYPSDCHDCVIRVPGIEARVRCTGVALEVIFPRPGSPADLVDGFAAVRDAFQISKALRGLIG